MDNLSNKHKKKYIQNVKSFIFVGTFPFNMRKNYVIESLVWSLIKNDMPKM